LVRASIGISIPFSPWHPAPPYCRPQLRGACPDAGPVAGTARCASPRCGHRR